MSEQSKKSEMIFEEARRIGSKASNLIRDELRLIFQDNREFYSCETLAISLLFATITLDQYASVSDPISFETYKEHNLESLWFAFREIDYIREKGKQ